MQLTKTLVLAAVLTAMNAQATIWYVDDVATHGDGSGESPWNSVSYALAHVTVKGDTIHIKAGNYTESAQMNLAYGVNMEGEGRDATIIMTAAPNIGLLLSSNSGPPATDRFDFGQKLSHFRFQTLNMTTQTGIKNYHRMNVVYDNLWLEGFKLQGTRTYSRDNSSDPAKQVPVRDQILDGIEIKNCYYKDCSFAAGTSYTGALEIGQVNHALVHDNVIECPRANPGYGIKWTQGGWIKNSKFYNNTINLTGIVDKTVGKWGQPFSIEFFYAHSDTEIYNNTFNGSISVVKDSGYPGTQLRIHDNRLIFPGNNDRQGIEGNASREEIYNNYFENVNANAIQVDWGADDFNIHHNVFRHITRSATITLNPRGAAGVVEDTRNINIYNNTFDDFVVGVALTGGTKGLGTISNVNIKNNIFMNSPAGKGVSVAVTTTYMTLSNVNVDYNDFYNVLTPNYAVAGGGTVTWSTHNLALAPALKLSGAFPFPYYEHSSGTGNMVNAGNATDLDYTRVPYVTTPDLGANEWGGGQAMEGHRVIAKNSTIQHL